MSDPLRYRPRWSRFHAQGNQVPHRSEIAPGDLGTELSLPAAPKDEASEIWSAEPPAEEPLAEGKNVAAPGGSPDELPRGFQMRAAYAEPATPSNERSVIFPILGGLLLLGIGGVVGYWLAPARTVSGPSVYHTQPVEGLTLALDKQTQADVDAAFEANKQHQFKDAQTRFDALYKAHPEWPSMAIEKARATLYDKDAGTTLRILSDLVRSDDVPDASFLMALARMTHKNFPMAEQNFSMAAALDPARPDIYYFWGECLRSEGKPQEAVEKFRSAILRNQYETADTLYQLKLWLSLIQSDQEESSGANAKIDAALATPPRPPYSAAFAAAARAIKAGNYKQAADWIAKGQQYTEPVVFHVILQDPTFMQESWRPELKAFYR